MILHVAFEQFAPTVRRLLKTKEVFAKAQGQTVRLTAADPDKPAVVASTAAGPLDAARTRLEEEGLEVLEGEWRGKDWAPEADEIPCASYIAAVAYSSREPTPGLWVDAYPAAPLPGTVLRAFYDELAGNGEIPEVSFEEFVRLTSPNVVILGPEELQSYVASKLDCD
jgi:hypothetical protein